MFYIEFFYLNNFNKKQPDKMNRIIAYAFVISSLVSNAQNKSCEERVDELLIEKIKAYPSNELIPYFSAKDNKWGFFDRKTKKKITSPIFHDACFFHPHLNFYYSFEQKNEDGCNGKILGSENNYQIEHIASSEYQIFTIEAPEEIKKSYKQFIKPEITGFEIDDRGKLTYFNPRFYDKENDEPTILTIFRVQEESYAIIKYKEDTTTFYAVINQQGAAFPYFERLSNYPQKKQSYTEENDIWFWIETEKDQYIFRSLKQGTRLPETFNYSPNWENNAQTIGYGIFVSGKKTGVLDLTTMQWKIKLSTKNKFSYLQYASLKTLEINYAKDEFSYNPTVTIPLEMIDENRKKTYIYIQNLKEEYLDLDGNLYKVKR